MRRLRMLAIAAAIAFAACCGRGPGMPCPARVAADQQPLGKSCTDRR